ncbi:DUF6257 family protein [Streptomyces olivaceus]|uniref:DUF6257 family protein n=1 Tax=Streptomyces olivaceus TaxID=47716 RepID=UPI001CCAB74E|nr:DUF6257 family protein [Streptomyces olivaceus]MBZ6135756.1 hypothetical protein [Streptomyces olivaceus]
MAVPDLNSSDYTVSEKARLAVLIARMAKRGLADDGTDRVDQSDLRRKFDRIQNQARKRKQQNRR